MSKNGGYALLFPILIVLMTNCSMSSREPVDNCSQVRNPASAPQSVILGGGSNGFEWTPDSQSIVFSVSREGLFIADTDQAQSVRQISFEGIHESFDMARKSAVVTYSSDSLSSDQLLITLLDIDELITTQLTTSEYDEIRPALSPSGQQMVLSRNDGPEARNNVYIRDLSTLDDRLLLDIPAWGYRWHPNGLSLAFISDVDGTDGLHFITIEDSVVVNVLNLDECDVMADLEWSKSGKFISYTRFIGNRIEVDVLGRDTEGQSFEETMHWEGAQASWSPTAMELAYVTFDADHQDIAILTMDEQEHRKLTNTEQEMESLPKWSPDGRKIAFLVYAPTTQQWHIDMVDLLSNERIRLVTID